MNTHCGVVVTWNSLLKPTGLARNCKPPLLIKRRFVGLLAQMKLAFFGLKRCDTFFKECLTFGQIRVLKLKLFEDSARFEQQLRIRTRR